MFKPRSDDEHAAMFNQVLGALPPEHMIEDARKEGCQLFRSDFRLHWPDSHTPQKDLDFIYKLMPLRKLCSWAVDDDRYEERDFTELISWMLHYDPRQRITAKE